MAFTSRLCRLAPFPRLVVRHVSCRGIFTTRFRAEKPMEELKSNPYYEKYASKISQLQKMSSEKFLQGMASSETDKTIVTSEEKGGRANPIASSTSSGMVKEKKLDDYMKIDMLKNKSVDEITSIWKERHSGRDAVAAVIPAEMYEQMRQRFIEYKTFLLPLPRKQGYEFVVVQFDGNEAHLTTLLNYQAFTANAPECLNIVHYPDIAKDKGIVLMVAEYDKNTFTRGESSCLCDQLAFFYGGSDDKALALLHRFTHHTREFNALDLLAQFEVTFASIR